MKVVIAGGSGLVGQALAERLLRRGDEVVVLTRSRATCPSGRCVEWGGTDDAWKSEIGDADAVVNLAGASIAEGRWTRARKGVLRDSRVGATRAIVDALRERPRPTRVLVSASAIGYYGPRGDEELSEASPPGVGFLAELATSWEDEALRGSDVARVVVLRTGVVLSSRGGALGKMLPAFRLGVGGKLGGGGQWMSWIHVDDVVAMIEWVMESDSVRGAVNATAPNPVTNAEFTRALARTLHRPAIMTVPGFALRLLLGEMAEALLLTGQRVVPTRATAEGFQFAHRDLTGALESILGG